MSALAHDLLKDQAPDTRVQLGFRDYRRLTEVSQIRPLCFRVARNPEVILPNDDLKETAKCM